MSESHWPVPYWDIDAGMAALLMLLTAVDGLGACFFGVNRSLSRHSPCPTNTPRSARSQAMRPKTIVLGLGRAAREGRRGPPRRR
jgi:hypothetical protein